MKSILIISLAFSFAICQTASIGLQKQLNPVHGLFIKPSEDGVTGDLYVAATEDDGVSSQWLMGQPVNFLPTGALTQAQAASMPVTFTSSLTSSSTPNDETVTTQKRAVITSPPMKYPYAVQAQGASEGTQAQPYSYGFYAPNTQNTEEVSPCRPEGLTPTSALPAYPYPYYYPHMLTALSAAMHALKENGDDTGPKISQSQPHGWPAAYAYPYQYIMVDPSAWSHSLTTSGKINKESETETEQKDE